MTVSGEVSGILPTQARITSIYDIDAAKTTVVKFVVHDNLEKGDG